MKTMSPPERVPAPRAAAAAAPALVRPGENCWHVDRAHRFACIQDAADYFRLVRQALLAARHSVFILGWDIQATLELVPGHTGEIPSRLDQLLAFIARRRPRLRCYVLIWDHAALYTLERDPLTRWRLGWRMPRGIRFGFDDHHPVGGSHHQKIVVVDDALAFCGGIDLTGHRWDTPAHRVDEPARCTALGGAYGPYHEVQAMVDGPAAARLGALARDRWRALGERIRPPQQEVSGHWPPDVTPDLCDVDVAIARTVPPSEREPDVRECERLFVDAIAGARDSIYIESQYFTHEDLGHALAERLRPVDGPEIVVVVPRECHGWLERQTMGALREGVCRHLLASDRHGRLRLVYPAASQRTDVDTFVHSKVMLVDDRFVRIGSANVSRRSAGVDTECDLAVEVGPAARDRAGVRRIRTRLLGEHMGLDAAETEQALAGAGSMRALIDQRQDHDRTLRPLTVSDASEPPAEALRVVADPGEPIQFAPALGALVPPLDVRSSPGVLRLSLPAVATAVAVAVLVRRLAPADAPSVAELLSDVSASPSALAAGVVLFVAGQFLLLPLELLAVGAGVVYGGLHGAAVALAGSWIASVLGYGVGRTLGASRVGRLVSRRSARAVRQLATHGRTGIALLRLTPMAGAAAVHLIGGAGRTPFGAYLTGSMLGLTPVAVSLALLGSLVRRALLAPSVAHWAMAGGAALLLAGAAGVLRTVLLLRQFAPSVARQRQRAEFG